MYDIGNLVTIYYVNCFNEDKKCELSENSIRGKPDPFMSTQDFVIVASLLIVFWGAPLIYFLNCCKN